MSGEPVELEAADVDARLAVEHKLADGLAGGGRDAEAVGRGGDDDVVAGGVEDVDDGQVVGGLLDDAGPAPDYRRVRGSREQLGEAASDVPDERVCWACWGRR